MKVVTFGEIMLRLSPKGFKRFVQADDFEVQFGGSEANVAVALSNFGVDTTFVSKMPKNEIAMSAITSLRKYLVDTSNIVYGDGRVGIYFMEKGVDKRSSKVIYDRAFSAFAMSAKSDYNWDEIFKEVDWFHFSGITPALGDNIVDICFEALKAAKERNITISCDINYRKNLWSVESASKVMVRFMEYVDVCIANKEHADIVLGVSASGEDDLEDISRKLALKYNFKKVVLTIRKTINANNNVISAMMYDGKEFAFSKDYNIDIVDRVGSGDALSAGIIYSILHNKTAKETIDFAVASSCLKHSIEGDFSISSVEEILSTVSGTNDGLIQR